MTAGRIEVETGTSQPGDLRSRALSNGAAEKFWHASVPERVRKSYRAGDEPSGWTAWRDFLAQRREPVPLGKCVPGNTLPLTWALPDHVDSARVLERLALVENVAGKSGRRGSAEQASVDWLSGAKCASPGVEHALETLAWCHALPRLARSVSMSTWWSLLSDLLSTADEATHLALQNDPLLHQLLCGELPLTLAYLFPEIVPCRKLAEPARDALSAGLSELLDGEGLPHGTRLGVFRPLMACWTRCRAMGGGLPKGCWNAEAENQYRWVVRAALRLTRHDGSQVLSSGSVGAWCRNLFDAALQLAGDEDDRDIAAVVLPGVRKSKAKRVPLLSLPDPAVHSEWAAISMLRPAWPRKEPRLTAVWSGKGVAIELDCGSDVVWSGRWELDVRCDDQPLEPSSDWEEICWYTDDEVDYLELEISLGERIRVQRHLLMAREDRFLLVADAILGRERSKLEYRGVLPLAGSIRFQPANETHEGFLIGKKPRALALPLALPEWRCGRPEGTLSATDGGLELTQSSEGSAMFAPLFLDLDSRRMKRPFTWRRLTVAENRQTLPHDAAVGYRVMVGRDQWLIYRTLAETGNRTLLGHNLVSQMLVARFSDGEVDAVLEIE